MSTEIKEVLKITREKVGIEGKTFNHKLQYTN